jgi:ADP-heptose:LPS heptosyltransferase
VVEATGELTRYWVLNAGSKKDYPLKQYHRWQEVVDLASAAGIKVVQIGDPAHNHPKLKGAIDMIGKTPNHRKLYRVIYKADGVLSCVSYAMHIAAAFMKPAVIVAGGREGTRWELYPHHRFLYQNGNLPCCSYDGCWKSKLEDCVNPVATVVPAKAELEGGGKGRFVNVPKCLEMTKPQQIVDAMLAYYEGGMIPALPAEVAA